MCSGGDTKLKAAEQSQAEFAKTLQGAFSKQFGARSAIFDFLTKTLTNNINNPQGMSPEALAAARTQATQRTATDVDQAQRAVQGKMAARGGSTLPSGVDAQVLGSIAASGANQESQMQGDITLQNEKMRQENYWNSIGGLSNVSAQEDPNGLAGGANSAADSVASLGSALNASKQVGFGSHLLNSFGDALGKTLGGGNGAGTGFGGL
jgi:hypothetical protein